MLPAASAVLPGAEEINGPQTGVNVTPYGSRYTFLCPDFARNSGTGVPLAASRISARLRNLNDSKGAATSKIFSDNAVLKSLPTAERAPMFSDSIQSGRVDRCAIHTTAIFVLKYAFRRSKRSLKGGDLLLLSCQPRLGLFAFWFYSGLKNVQKTPFDAALVFDIRATGAPLQESSYLHNVC